MPQYCPDCGRENSDTAKNCCVCGEKMDISGTALMSTLKLLDNRYEIISTIKSGAMGCVYKARDTRLDNTVAIKQMLSSISNPQDAQYAEARFKQEAKMLSALKHNGLPKVIDFFIKKEPSTGESLHYLVMEFIEGKDLETIMQERGQKPFLVDETVDYFKQILDIFQYLHAQNPPIVYRDLNPRNIMIQNGKIFLVDFGIARFFTPQQKGTAIGTPGYAAPEQYKGAAEPRSDIFSLGVVIHYLITGNDPEDASHSNLFNFEQPRKMNPSVPEYLDTLIMSMVDIVIDHRPQSAEKIKNELMVQSLEKPQIILSPSPPVSSSQSITNTSSSVSVPALTQVSHAKKMKAAIVISILLIIGWGVIYMAQMWGGHAFLSKTPLPTESTPDIQNKDEKYEDIFAAIIAGNIQAVKAFVRKKPSLINVTKDGMTPLHLASKSFIINAKDIVELLISKGADVNAKDKEDGKTPLAMAKDKDIAGLLISRGADVNSKGRMGMTPLHWASQADRKDVVELLISKGANVNAKLKNDGWTPLHFASMNVNKDVAELLISKGADVNTKGSPLHWASSYGNKDVAELLISKGADVNARDYSGKTPLHRAFNKDTAILLISKGANVNAKDKDGMNPLAMAKDKDIAGLLISRGADVNLKGRMDMTPLHWASFNGNKDVAELLISKGADVNARDYNGKTPLYKASSKGRKEIVELLKKHGAKE